MRVALRLVALTLLPLAAGSAVSAHHSVPVNFDTSQEMTVEGVVTEVVWRNPHSRFRIEVKDEAGSTVEWLVEMGASNTMKRAGFPMERFMVGDRLTITGNPGRRDRTIFLRETVLPDGTRLDPEMRRGAQP